MASRIGGQTMTMSSYDTFKNQVEAGTIVRKTLNFLQFEILSENKLSIQDVVFPMEPKAFKSLIRLIGISNATYTKVNDTIGGNSGHKLVQLMKTAMAGIADKNSVCLIVNKNSGVVVDVVKSAEGILSNGAFFSIFEDVINNHKGMEIKNMAISQDGNVEITVINHNWEFNVGGLKDEYFKSGLVFINTMNETIITPFNERLVCTNGMVVSENGHSLILKNGEVSHQRAFFDAARNLKGVQSFEQDFKRRIIRMMDTVSSYGELKTAKVAMVGQVVNAEEQYVKETIESFLPELMVKREFLKYNVDLESLTPEQWARIKTPHTVWEVVNKLTDLSSHPEKNGLTLKEGNHSIFVLQKTAGNICFKPMYDLESPVKQLF